VCKVSNKSGWARCLNILGIGSRRRAGRGGHTLAAAGPRAGGARARPRLPAQPRRQLALGAGGLARARGTGRSWARAA